MDDKRKFQNRINQQNRRLRLKENDEYKKKKNEKAREQYKNRKERDIDNDKEIFNDKTKSIEYSKNMINEVFDKIINEIPERSESKIGRPIEIILKDDMTDREKRAVERKIKHREYMRIYMRNKKLEKP